MAQVLGPVGGGSNAGEVVTLADGGYMAVWVHLVTPLLPIPNVTDDQFFAVLGRSFNTDGTPRGDVFQINQSTDVAGQFEPDLTVLSNGNVVAVWTHGPDLSNGADVAARGRIFAPDGTPLTDEFDLTSTTTRDQNRAQVTATADGGFFAVWADGRFSNTDERWFGQQFDADGTPVGPEMHLGNIDATQRGELLAPRADTLFVYGDAGAIFDPSETYDFLQGIQRPTSITQIVSPGSSQDGEFEDAVAMRDDGLIAILRPGDISNAIRLEFQVVRDVEAPDATYPDGTPYPDTHPTLDSAPASLQSVNILLQEVSGISSVSDLTSVAATFRPDGTLAVVWIAPSALNGVTHEFSVFAQILSPEGVPISKRVVISSDNVQGGQVYPPFVSAGDDGRLFIGWTGTTDRNGPGTNEVMGGVFDVPTQTTGDGPLGWLGSDARDQPALGDTPRDQAFLFGGDDLWIQSDNSGVNRAFGMEGDDHFLAAQPRVGGFFVPGLGRDVLDYSALSEGLSQFFAPNPAVSSQENNSSLNFEVVIGTLHDDHLSAPFGNDFHQPDLRGLLHAEAGNDTIDFQTTSGGEIDGGDGTDMMVTLANRADFQLTRTGDHYTLAALWTSPGGGDPEPNPQYTMILHSIEGIRFADEMVRLDPTASRDSGARGNGGVMVNEISGTEADDLLDGTNAPDLSNGLGGNDTLSGFDGNDTLLGGAGDDLAYSGIGNDSLSGGIGADTLYGAAGNDTLDGGDGGDLLGAGAGDDSMSGAAGNDALWTAAGNDTAEGGSGSDTLGGAGGNDSLSGGDGDDEMWGAAGDDTLSGGAGSDTLGASFGADSLSGGDDGDEMWGAAGNDTLSGDAGDDTIGAGGDNDLVSGGAGNDQVFGGLGDDQLSGDSGNDTLFGAAGDDTIDGGAGDDHLYAGPGFDEIVFSTGSDTVFFFSTAQDQIDLTGVGSITDFADLQANHLSEAGGNAVISDGAGNSLTLDGVAMSALAADDFLFAP